MRKISSYVEKTSLDGYEPFDLGFSFGLMELAPGVEYTFTGVIEEIDKKMYDQKMRKKRRRY